MWRYSFSSLNTSKLYFLLFLKLCFGLCCVFDDTHRLSLVAVSGGFSLQWLLLFGSTGSGHAVSGGFSLQWLLSFGSAGSGHAVSGGFSLQLLLSFGSAGSGHAGSVVWPRALSRGSLVVAHGLPCSMWGLPRPGIEPVSPTLAGGVLTPGSPGKSSILLS